ncbi:late control protein D [Ancylobacter sp. A5.8]|uniref:phage late control D family protein n=1 Tax=Ancylobacter gelatini TaxID=2919920 RepID=UPI001F4D66B5|nr:contractile injection system protein, VgrG/Pvc8 family [Ancylobacter gelatini]MCJ8142974.1 late control protein D [Ancylobacter gelatini]
MEPRAPLFRLTYAGRDITSEFSQWPVEITYTDNHHGKADECTVKVHNSNGAWLDIWEPQNGDVFSLDYGYEDGAPVPAGEFTVDESGADGDAGGDTVDFKGLAAPKTKELRTEKHRAFEQQSLSEIVAKIASEHGFQLEGEIEDLDYERVDQNGERDLAFLTRLAEETGHFFTVKGKRLVFTSRNALRSTEPVKTFDRVRDFRQTLLRYSLRDADHVAAARAEVRYQHPRRKKVISGSASSADDLGLMTNSGDVVKLDVRVENEQQAERLAKSKLDQKNSPKYSGSLDMVGDPPIVAGVVIGLTGFGNKSGKYLVTSAKHRKARSGYTTSVEIEGLTDKQASDGKAASASPKTKKSGASAVGSTSSTGTSLGVMGADGVIRQE